MTTDQIDDIKASLARFGAGMVSEESLIALIAEVERLQASAANLDVLIATAKQLTAAVNASIKRSEWIPCSEQKPTGDCDVFLYEPKHGVCFYNRTYLRLILDGLAGMDSDIKWTHWTKAPESPQ